jgi:hypothetical protein
MGQVMMMKMEEEERKKKSCIRLGYGQGCQSENSGDRDMRKATRVKASSTQDAPTTFAPLQGPAAGRPISASHAR